MMRGPLWSSLLLGLAVLLPLCARAQDENKPILVVFGDSLADTGNSDAITREIPGNIHPPPDYYYEGRFSDGLMWPDYVKNSTGWDMLNYAVGSTTACPLSDRAISFNASLGIQVSKFLQKEVPWMDEDSPEESQQLLNSYRPLVIAIMSSNNDFQYIYGQALQEARDTGVPVDDVMQGLINNGTLDATAIASCYMEAVSQLLPSDEQTAVDLRRVRGMVLYGPAAVHQTPLTLNHDFIGFSNTTREMIGGVVEGLSTILESRVSEMQLPSGVQVEFVNLTSLQQRYANGGFTEFAPDPIVVEPCLEVVGIQGAQDVNINGTCDNPPDYMFWDSVHPRTSVHEALATFSMETIKAAASGPKSAPADQRSGEAAIDIKTRVSGYSGDDLSANEGKKEDLFKRLSSAVAQNLALMRPELMLVEDASELDLAEPTQRRALQQVAGPCVECVKNEIIKTDNTSSSEDSVIIKTTVFLPDNTDQSTLENVVVEIQSEGTSIFRGSGEESNIEINAIQVGDDGTGGGGGDNPDDPDPDGGLDGALHPFTSVTTCIASVLSAILLAAF